MKKTLLPYFVLIVASCYTNMITAQTMSKENKVQAITLTFNTSLTSSFINPPAVSGVINDPTDPAKTVGIVVDIKDDGSPITAANYTLTAASSKTSVVSNANIIITKADGTATIKITPTGIGYANITLTLTKASSSKTLTINYAASVASTTPTTTFWHTGYSDASATVSLDNDFMVMADDEKNNLYVVNRSQSGLPVKTYYFGDLLGLTDGSAGDYKEVDVEACVRSRITANKVYWLGSMSNAGSSNIYKVNSNKLFATTITGTGSTTSFSVNGYYSSLRQRLIIWGDANGYNFTSSTSSGHDAKTIDGFNVEGMTIGPDNTTLYISFRAPLVPTANRTKAVIAPLLNFETWFNNGSPSGNPTFGNPIELNLGGRGIRDIVRLSNGVFIIVAGNYDNTPLNGAIFKWTGVATDAPIQITNMDISTLNAEACIEINENNNLALNKLQIISDNGSFEFYNDGTQAKDLTNDTYKKYRSDIITAPSNVLPMQLDYFTVTKQNNNALLNWKVLESSSIKQFEVFRSINNSNNFISIATINKTNDKNNYSFTDKILQPTTVYYKIKFIEPNGNSTYSNIRAISFNEKNAILKVYPNPVTANSFSVTTDIVGNKKVDVYNSIGALITTLNFSGTALDIQTNHWSKGNYLLIISSNNTILGNEKVVIQ
jgi:hypothetical protein